MRTMTTCHPNGLIEDVYASGFTRWTKNGKSHREDGPAITHGSGNVEYWINGVELSEKEFNIITLQKELNEELSTSINNLKQPKI